MSHAQAATAASDALISNYDTDRIWRDDKAHFVHPFTHFDSFKRDGSLVITGAKGAHITDSRGKRYLDGIGGLWCMSIGSPNQAKFWRLDRRMCGGRRDKTPESD